MKQLLLAGLITLLLFSGIAVLKYAIGETDPNVSNFGFPLSFYQSVSIQSVNGTMNSHGIIIENLAADLLLFLLTTFTINITLNLFNRKRHIS